MTRHAAPSSASLRSAPSPAVREKGDPARQGWVGEGNLSKELARTFSWQGLFFEFGNERLKNPVEILNYIVVPNADHSITEGA